MFIQSLIKQDQSLKNDYNEHLASKCSSRHAKEAITYDYLHVQSHDQCKIQEVYASRNKILLGYKCEVLKTYWQYLKSTKKNATKH